MLIAVPVCEAVVVVGVVVTEGGGRVWAFGELQSKGVKTSVPQLAVAFLWACLFIKQQTTSVNHPDLRVYVSENMYHR